MVTLAGEPAKFSDRSVNPLSSRPTSVFWDSEEPNLNPTTNQAVTQNVIAIIDRSKLKLPEPNAQPTPGSYAEGSLGTRILHIKFPHNLT